MSQMSPTMNIMIKAAEKASRSLLHDFNEVEKLQVSQKSPGDFVSKADIRSEEIIFEELMNARRDYAFLMEEAGVKNEGKSEYTWIIDPLDGTANFLYGIPHWAISIGLKKGDEIIAGLVLDPVKNELFRAEKGQGAFVNRARLRVSGRKDLSLAAVFSTAYFAGRKADDPIIKQHAMLQKCVQNIRCTGSMTLDLSYIAAGRSDFVSDSAKPWDIAAGAILIKEAGGKVTDRSLGQNFLENNEVVAGNPFIYEKLVELLGFRKKAA